MEIVLAIDEADIGQVEAGQEVALHRRCLPRAQLPRQGAAGAPGGDQYQQRDHLSGGGEVDNTDQLLLPGMTANAEIEVSRRDDVLRVSNAALRYKPA